ncbi:MAG: GTP-binding protein [archaeon]|nr:GTP-binding protein [archaeon]
MASSTGSIHITVLGKAAVGKTSLIYSYLGVEMTDYDTTIEEKYETTEAIDGKPTQIIIMDTAGQEDYQASLMDLWVNFGDGIILVYSIIDKDSFNALPGIYNKVISLKRNAQCPIILVGNKKDLADEREVTIEEAKALAKKWGCPYYETSATMKIKCKDPFIQCINDAAYNLDRRQGKAPKGKKGASKGGSSGGQKGGRKQQKRDNEACCNIF